MHGEPWGHRNSSNCFRLSTRSCVCYCPPREIMRNLKSENAPQNCPIPLIMSAALNVKSSYAPSIADQGGPYPGFCSIKRPWIFLMPLHGMLVNHRINPNIKFASTHLYTWLKRDTLKLKCLAQEHAAMSQPNLEPGILNPETLALRTRPPRLPAVLIKLEA